MSSNNLSRSERIGSTFQDGVQLDLHMGNPAHEPYEAVRARSDVHSVVRPLEQREIPYTEAIIQLGDNLAMYRQQKLQDDLKVAA